MNPMAIPIRAATAPTAWSWQRLVTALVATVLAITVLLGVGLQVAPDGQGLTWGPDTARYFKSPGKRLPIETPQSARLKPLPHPRMPYG